MSDNPFDRDELARTIREFDIVEYYKVVSRTFQALARPGIAFTPEQMEHIRELLEQNGTIDAQRKILDGLENIEDDDH